MVEPRKIGSRRFASGVRRETNSRNLIRFCARNRFGPESCGCADHHGTYPRAIRGKSSIEEGIIVVPQGKIAPSERHPLGTWTTVSRPGRSLKKEAV